MIFYVVKLSSFNPIRRLIATIIKISYIIHDLFNLKIISFTFKFEIRLKKPFLPDSWLFFIKYHFHSFTPHSNADEGVLSDTGKVRFDSFIVFFVFFIGLVYLNCKFKCRNCYCFTALNCKIEKQKIVIPEWINHFFCFYLVYLPNSWIHFNLTNKTRQLTTALTLHFSDPDFCSHREAVRRRLRQAEAVGSQPLPQNHSGTFEADRHQTSTLRKGNQFLQVTIETP